MNENINANIAAKKIDALLEIGMALIEERSKAISEVEIEYNASITQANNVLKSTESLLTLIILGIDGRMDEMLKEADSVLKGKQVL